MLSWLESGLVAWFGFYFAIGDGSPQSRLTQASGDELDKASERLEAAAKLIAQLPSRGTGWHGTVAGYGDAVAMWGTAIDLIANGARFDRAGVAREGLERMDDASAAAERVVDIEAGPAHLVDLKGPLWTLERLKPSKKVPAKAIDEAKRPWERALIASGSMLDWSPFPS